MGWMLIQATLLFLTFWKGYALWVVLVTLPWYLRFVLVSPLAS